MSETNKDAKVLDDFPWDEFEEGTAANISKEELDKAYEESQNVIADHQIIDGTVISIDRKEVVVNIGYKSDGIIPASEFRYNPDLKIGDKVKVYVVCTEDKKGQLILSHKKASSTKSWMNIKEALETGVKLTGYIKCHIKGGFLANILGVDTFLPNSQIELSPIKDYHQYVGKTMDFKVVQLIEEPEFAVVSHRAISDSNYADHSFLKSVKLAIKYFNHEYYNYFNHDNDNDDYLYSEDYIDQESHNEKRRKSVPPEISQMVHTHGRLFPCPHCGSRFVDTYSDGTARCRDCDNWYYYA